MSLISRQFINGFFKYSNCTLGRCHVTNEGVTRVVASGWPRCQRCCACVQLASVAVFQCGPSVGAHPPRRGSRGQPQRARGSRFNLLLPGQRWVWSRDAQRVTRRASTVTWRAATVTWRAMRVTCTPLHSLLLQLFPMEYRTYYYYYFCLIRCLFFFVVIFIRNRVAQNNYVVNE